MSIKKLRAEIKPLGFTITTKSFSWGKSAIYKHISSGQLLTFNVFGKEHIERWGVLLSFLEKNKGRILAEWEGEKIYGIMPTIDYKLG